MKNLAVAVTFLVALTGIVHTLDAEAKQDVRVVQLEPGVSAPVAFADDAQGLDAENKKKKKKKKGEREEDEEEYRAFASA